MMKKILLFLLLSFLMTGSAFADCLMYIDDFMVTPNQMGTEIELRVKAEFSARLNSWSLYMTFPEGLTPTYAEPGADFDITYINSRGNTEIYTPIYYTNDTYTSFIGFASQLGYWYDPNNGNALTSYGAVKWEVGTYEEMIILYVEVSEDFSGGEIILNSQFSSTDDARGGTIKENGDQNSERTCTCNVTVAGPSEAYACYTPSNTTLTFYYDGLRNSRYGTTYDLNRVNYYPKWFKDSTNASVTRVVFDPSFADARPTTTECWFLRMSNLQSITGMQYLNTSNVTSMSSMFSGCSGLSSIDVSGFNTANLTNISGLFENCGGLTSLDLSHLNTDNVTNMRYMFSNCTGLTSLDLSHFNTDNVTNMEKMFYGCRGLTSVDLSSFNTDKVTTMSLMFAYCRGLTSLDVSGFNTANVTSMYSMFDGCRGLTSLDVSGFNTAKVTTMYGMFCDCDALTSLDVSSFNTANLTDMRYMFDDCDALTSVDLTGFNTANVTTMSFLFYNCISLTSLDLSGFNTSKVTEMNGMFSRCSDLTTIYASDGWTTAALTESSTMFYGCSSLVGGMGTTFNSSHIDAAYAHIDGGPSNPGYFTYKPASLRGDVNGNGVVNIADVTDLIDLLLNGGTIDNPAADCNKDYTVNIADVTALIDYLLNGSW